MASQIREFGEDVNSKFGNGLTSSHQLNSIRCPFGRTSSFASKETQSVLRSLTEMGLLPMHATNTLNATDSP